MLEFVTIVAVRPFGRKGVEWKTILRRALNASRNVSE
jgi:hypothetical protein